RDFGAGARQRFREQSSAAAHVEHARVAQPGAFIHVTEAHGIELVQRLELTVHVPEAMGRGVEFGDFRGVAVWRIRAFHEARNYSGAHRKTGAKTAISKRRDDRIPHLFLTPPDMNEIAREILPVNLEDEMRQSYLDYAMSVIVGRALPDV